ncbi:MAG: YkgJ family cysteine cluster protein [Nitrospiraceae bacterium]
MLDPETNRCKIYEMRPPVCRVDEMYDERPILNQSMSRREWHITNVVMCHLLIDRRGLPDDLYPLVPGEELVAIRQRLD